MTCDGKECHDKIENTVHRVLTEDDGYAAEHSDKGQKPKGVFREHDYFFLSKKV